MDVKNIKIKTSRSYALTLRVPEHRRINLDMR